MEGYVVLHDFLEPDLVLAVKAELEALDLVTPETNQRLSYYRQVYLADCPRAIDLIAQPRMLAFLQRLLGDDLICMSANYGRYAPGYPGMALHTDSQPYGSELFGPLSSVPVAVRIFYYLDDLTPERAPLRVVPYSHLCMNGMANPYQRISSHPEEETITCNAGSAVVINQRAFHAGGANHSDQNRSFYNLSYRPLWAGPVKKVPAHDREKIAALPQAVRKLFKPPNTRHADGRLPLRRKAGPLPLGPARWELGRGGSHENRS